MTHIEQKSISTLIIDINTLLFIYLLNVRKKAKIKNQYNQVPHLTQDTTWEIEKNTRKHHLQVSQDVSPFPAGEYRAAMYRHDSMTDMKHILREKIAICYNGFPMGDPKSIKSFLLGSAHTYYLFENELMDICKRSKETNSDFICRIESAERLNFKHYSIERELI